jgi:ATP-dependent Lon protease
MSDREELTIPDDLPLLPVRDLVVFPSMILPLFVGRERSIRAIDEALSRQRVILLVTQRNAEVEDPDVDDLHRIGTIALIMRMLKMPDGRIKILVQGLSKASITSFLQKEPFLKVAVSRLEDPPAMEPTMETEAMVGAARQQLQKAASLGKSISPDVLLIADNLEDAGRLADLVVSNLSLKTDEAQGFLEITDPLERLRKATEILNREISLLEMQRRIMSSAEGEINKTQRDYYLREQLKAIHKELGEVDGKSEEIDDYRRRIAESGMPEGVRSTVEKQLGRLERMHPDAAEAAVIRTHLDWLVGLPWTRTTRDSLDIREASRILDEDHYDLEKVKTRILEYLSVRRLRERMKGPILLFVGPPGVGKTSLGRSIARSLGRKFVRISLGGVRDEAEIRGHRRTYVGALPGKIIAGIQEAGTSNPVFMIDEVDKIGADFRGDPSAALLEVLDPEQNNAFTDHYLGVPFDLSGVMFITTANLLDPIPSALKDRMEMIEIPGYTEEEKLLITRRYLIPRQQEEHGIGPQEIRISDKAVMKIISDYTREAGLRNLEREVATICRKVARKVVEGERGPHRISPRNLASYLGIRKFYRESEVEQNQVGVATGLAWTQTGGELLHVETTVMKGRGNLSLTGHLGEVMKESAQAALSIARSRAPELGIPDGFFGAHDIHIHVPAGAIPKDGPSAGITLTSSLISALTGVPVSREVAMTGEVTLRGRVLPVGGLKEKVLAARRAGIRTIILPSRNQQEISEIPAALLKELRLVYADTVDQVLATALVPGKGGKGTTPARRPARGRRPLRPN